MDTFLINHGALGWKYIRVSMQEKLESKTPFGGVNFWTQDWTQRVDPSIRRSIFLSWDCQDLAGSTNKKKCPKQLQLKSALVFFDQPDL